MKRFLKSKLIVAVLLVLTVMIMAFPAAAASERPVGQFEITCRGDDVKLIQQRLVDLGYMQQKHTTGYFGTITEAAVIEYQEDNGIDAIGVVGPKTLMSLFDSTSFDTGDVYKMGQRSEDVRAIQRLLIIKGYLGSRYDTGYFGSLTYNAVKQFQKNNNLKADGIVGEDTIAKLTGKCVSASGETGTSVKSTTTTTSTYIAKAGTLRYGDKGSKVQELQNQLKKLGYFDATSTGLFLEITRDAVKDFQRDNGLVVDGIAGTKTFAKLESALKGESSGSKEVNFTASDSSSLQDKYDSLSSSKKEDIYLLAQLIYAESGHESYTGQVAVGSVVMNRVKQTNGTIEGVIFAKNQFSTAKKGYFSNTPSQSSLNAAIEAYFGAKPVGNSLYFNNKSVTNSWAARNRSLYCILGNHAFYV